MTTTFFTSVHEDVARNPVARAIQRRKVGQAILDFRLTMHFLEEGSDQRSNLLAAAQVLAVGLRVREQQGRRDDVPVMRGALSAIEDRSRHGFKWRPIDAVPIGVGLKAAEGVMVGASAVVARDAWRFVTRLEAAA